MRTEYPLLGLSGFCVAAIITLSACSSGSDPGSMTDEVVEGDSSGGDATGDGSGGSIPETGVEPLISSAGAPERLPGCLNSNLYRGGPHLLNTLTRVTNADMTSYTLNAQSTYTVLEERDDGSSRVSVASANTTDSGLTFASTNVYELDGLVLTLIGPVRETGLAPDPDPQEWFFGLAQFEDVGVSTASVDRGARSPEDGSILYADVSSNQTYMGNEVIETPMGSFQTCRVNSMANDALSESTVWYAVGSGVRVKTQNVFYNVGPDRITTQSGALLEFASINGVMISP